jgi:arginine:ornithine antiporter/lysine permease
MVLPAYIGSTGYLWKLIATGKYPAGAQIGKIQALVSSIIATIYGVWLVYAGGLQYMLCGTVFFALGNLVFIWSRREHAPHELPFTKRELAVAVALVVLGVLALWMLFTGNLKQVYTP